VFPRHLSGTLRSGGGEIVVSLNIVNETGAGGTRVAAEHFARREYLVKLPERVSGEVWLTVPSLAGTAALLTVASEATAPPTLIPPESEIDAVRADFEADPPEPVGYFKRNFFPYEPFYFVAGTRSPNAKFQFSFKYRLVDDRSGLAAKVGVATNFFAAFTQTSLWDWNADSAPFEDSSYKPEVLYLHESLVEVGEPRWLRFDLQGGVQHESNGREEPASRSLNIAYLRPTVVLGQEQGWQLSLSPRLWFYMADLKNNPDLERYRGYGDLRIVVGKQEGVQLATYLRVGDHFDRGSLQLDLTFPLREIRWFGLTWCVQAQYFTGYGESLLNYNERSEVLRFGFSIYR
jgi:phospholipase A1/A2